MKTNYLFPLTILFAVVLALSGCKKYDEGPGFTLRSVKNRLTNDDWKLQKLEIGGIDSTREYKEFRFELSFDTESGFSGNTYSFELAYTYFGELIKESGIIRFQDKGDQMQFINDRPYRNNNIPTSSIFSNSYQGPIWEIKKLTNKELWMETFIDRTFHSIKLTKD
jgi:hypothetical protein